jgi:L,D-peptidoglycan transpeptidase YkuD (ErfK/YbiS/YcfS/YnhG family)
MRPFRARPGSRIRSGFRGRRELTRSSVTTVTVAILATATLAATTLAVFGFAPAASARQTADTQTTAPGASAAATASTAPTQEVVVTGAYGSHSATLDTYQFTAGSWQHVLSAPAEVGYNGLSDHRSEGDGTTPTGAYTFGSTMYGISTVKPSSRYAYQHLTCGDWWDENSASPTYNQFSPRACGAPGPGAGSEALWESTVDYQHFALINYNINPTVPGRGAGIFLHDFTPSGVTAGCVAIPAAQLDSVLAWLDPAQHPVIRIGTKAEVSAPSNGPHLIGAEAGATGSGQVEVHSLAGYTGYATFNTHAATALRVGDPADWQFRFAPYARDGKEDLFAIRTANTGSGHVEVHVLSQASGYTQFLTHIATPLAAVPANQWQFQVAPVSGDTAADLVGIEYAGTASGHVEVHIISAASGYHAWSLHAATALATVAPGSWDFLVGDAAGRGNVVAVNRSGASSHTEVHVLSRDSGYHQFTLHKALPLAPTPATSGEFSLADLNGDGVPDLAVTLLQGTSSGHTELHVLNGATNFGQWQLHTATAFAALDPNGWTLQATAQ